jgi:hypothetical protein
MSRQTLSTILRAAIAAAGYQTHLRRRQGDGDRQQVARPDILAGEVSPTVDTLEKLFHAIGWEVTITFTPRE